MSKRVNILLVEDNELDAEMVFRGFRNAPGVGEIRHAVDGYEALDILRGQNGRLKMQSPFVVLLDLNLPRMNGFEFLEVVRSDPSLAKLSITAFTTSDRPQDVSTAYNFNVSGYIVKPATRDQLKRVLASLHEFWNSCELPEVGAAV